MAEKKKRKTANRDYTLVRDAATGKMRDQTPSEAKKEAATRAAAKATKEATAERNRKRGSVGKTLRTLVGRSPR